MNKKELVRKLIAAQQTLLDSAKAAEREMTDEEKKSFDDFQTQIDALNAEIEAEEKALANPEDHTKAIADERARVSEITTLCREFDVEADEYIKSGASIDSVRAAILESLKANHGALSTKADDDSWLTVTKDESDKFRDAATDALMLRSGLAVEKAASGAETLRGMSLKDLAVEALVRDGGNAMELHRKSASELYDMLQRDFYNPTAAFPAILDATIRKSIVDMYNHVPTTFQEWTSKGSLADFKVTADHEYVIGGIGDFQMVPENGEIKADLPRTELLPNRKLDTYGKSFSMTRQAFINDDIGFCARVPGLYATKAKQTIDKQCYELLMKNPAIFDGVTLFDDAHKNQVKVGTKPTQAAIQELILQMQKQVDQFGDAIYMNPEKIIVPVGYEFDLAVIFGSAKATGANANRNDINPLYNYPLTVVQSPVLNALAAGKDCPWFITASPASAKGIQVDYLNGQETPTVRRMEEAGVLGYTWDIYLDWGVSVRDFRGLYKNPGVQLA